MKKQVCFNENDCELIQRIKDYQKENEIQSFVEAIRRLCNNALNLNVNVKINLK